LTRAPLKTNALAKGPFASVEHLETSTTPSPPSTYAHAYTFHGDAHIPACHARRSGRQTKRLLFPWFSGSEFVAPLVQNRFLNSRKYVSSVLRGTSTHRKHTCYLLFFVQARATSVYF
jgi:hypothetical protein